jgi:hypothetical protein
MIRKTIAVRLFAVIALVFLAAVPMEARGKKSKSLTEPGTYEDWADEIDELEVVETFSFADYQKVLVAPFDTDDVELPEKSDNTYDAVKDVLKDPEEELVDGIREELDGKKVDEGSKGGAGTLIVRGKVVTMDPGSRAARYWAGFGAGAARTGIEAEIVDGATGKVLVKFTQERRSGVGAAGGGYEDLMNRNLEAIGEDIALILKQFK